MLPCEPMLMAATVASGEWLSIIYLTARQRPITIKTCRRKLIGGDSSLASFLPTRVEVLLVSR